MYIHAYNLLMVKNTDYKLEIKIFSIIIWPGEKAEFAQNKFAYIKNLALVWGVREGGRLTTHLKVYWWVTGHSKISFTTP